MLRILVTVGLASVIWVIAYSLSFYKAVDFLAIILALHAGVYFGLGLLDNRTNKRLLEGGVAIGFVVLILLSMWKSSSLIMIGYVAQMVWALLHYPLQVGARIAKWFVLMSLLFNLVVGSFIVLKLI